MTGLYWCEIREGLPIPDFGRELRAHIEAKRHPAVRAASLSAWHLLALVLRERGVFKLPAIGFSPEGKPYFEDEDLHFSLSHSGNLAAVILSDSPCAVDVELLRPETADKLRARCLSPAEQAQGCDFFEAWTKKECIAKLDGRGLPAHPDKIDTLTPEWADRFFSCTLRDAEGNRYALSALCEHPDGLKAEKRSIIER